MSDALAQALGGCQEYFDEKTKNSLEFVIKGFAGYRIFHFEVKYSVIEKEKVNKKKIVSLKLDIPLTVIEINEFEKLISFDCYNCGLEELPELPNTLMELKCSHNRLERLPKLPDSLELINCSCNKIKKLTEGKLPGKLKKLVCHANRIKEISEFPGNLAELYCYRNLINELNIKFAEKLTILDCSQNKLTSLCGCLINLKYFNCSFNKLEKLPELSNKCVEMSCSDNKLKV
ncbi:MAG: leucine-rich repeat domain-containing protein, partial [Nitrososphaeraceae archaeon]|nr:leucine-rich repeat domain-containing protein [Nitrososphaeraceae archaeon]